MAHLDDADADLHATPTSCGSTPSLNQIPVPERVDVSVPRTPTDDLSVGRKQDYTSGPRTSTRPEESPWSTSPGVLNGWAQAHSHFRMVFATRSWPAIGQQHVEPNDSRMISRESSPDSTAALEDSAETPAPSSHVLDDKADYEYRLSAPTFARNTPTPCQPIIRPSRAETSRTQRFLPYEVPRVHSNEHTDAEAGPSHLAPLHAPPTNPPGGSSEATASAETNKTITEEEADPSAQCLPSKDRRKLRDLQHQGEMRRLFAWAQKWKGLDILPTILEALEIALEVIHDRRSTMMSPVHKLKRNATKQRGQNARSEVAEIAARRREEIRRVYEELSRYFEVPVGCKEWMCPQLLLRVLQEVEHLERPLAMSSA